jgi:hypothetical protein
MPLHVMLLIGLHFVPSADAACVRHLSSKQQHRGVESSTAKLMSSDVTKNLDGPPTDRVRWLGRHGQRRTTPGAVVCQQYQPVLLESIYQGQITAVTCDCGAGSDFGVRFEAGRAARRGDAPARPAPAAKQTLTTAAAAAQASRWACWACYFLLGTGMLVGPRRESTGRPASNAAIR